LNAKLIDTKWYVTNVSTNHNHALIIENTRFHKCHKNLDSFAKKRLLLNDDVEKSMNNNFNSLAIEARGYENLAFGKKDCCNFIAKEPHLQLDT
jgi:hypothetical protein